jgi:hypothetical protein
MKTVDYPELVVGGISAPRGSFEEEFQSIFSEALNLLIRKQARYGNTNIDQLGIHGVVSRIAFDKVSRAQKFLQGRVIDGKVVLDEIDGETEESLEDTLMDMANYSLIAISLLRGTWGKPLALGETDDLFLEEESEGDSK